MGGGGEGQSLCGAAVPIAAAPQEAREERQRIENERFAKQSAAVKPKGAAAPKPHAAAPTLGVSLPKPSPQPRKRMGPQPGAPGKDPGSLKREPTSYGLFAPFRSACAVACPTLPSPPPPPPALPVACPVYPRPCTALGRGAALIQQPSCCPPCTPCLLDAPWVRRVLVSFPFASAAFVSCVRGSRVSLLLPPPLTFTFLASRVAVCSTACRSPGSGGKPSKTDPSDMVFNPNVDRVPKHIRDEV